MKVIAKDLSMEKNLERIWNINNEALAVANVTMTDTQRKIYLDEVKKIMIETGYVISKEWR